MKKIKIILVLILLINMNLMAQTVDLKSGLVGFYPFNGNANDESGNGNNGTVQGATLTNDRTGQSNSAYSFDGYSNFIKLPSSNSTNSNSYSIFTWIKTSNAGSSYCGIVVKQLAVGILLKDNELISFDWKNRVDKNTSCYLADNYWHLVGLVVDNGTIKFYKDGAFISSSNSYSILSQSENFAIGAGGMNGGQYFKGLIDDVRIYNRALNEAEIQALYNGKADEITVNNNYISASTNIIDVLDISKAEKILSISCEKIEDYLFNLKFVTLKSSDDEGYKLLTYISSKNGYIGCGFLNGQKLPGLIIMGNTDGNINLTKIKKEIIECGYKYELIHGNFIYKKSNFYIILNDTECTILNDDFLNFFANSK
jgi:hypothetical protein